MWCPLLIITLLSQNNVYIETGPLFRQSTWQTSFNLVGPILPFIIPSSPRIDVDKVSRVRPMLLEGSIYYIREQSITDLKLTLTAFPHKWPSRIVLGCYWLQGGGSEHWNRTRSKPISKYRYQSPRGNEQNPVRSWSVSKALTWRSHQQLVAPFYSASQEHW